MNNKLISKRNIGLDLLRIISMIMIMSLHYLGKGGALTSSGNVSYIAWFLEISCMVAVNLYVLISGYFLVDGKFSWKKVIKLCIDTWFYSLSFLILELIFGSGTSIKEILCGVFPILLKVYWFVTIYIFMYIMSPYLNILINNMNKIKHFTLCLILIIIFSCLHLFLPPMGLLNPQGGYGIIWFITLYLIAGYIKRYVNVNKKPIMLIIFFITTIFLLILKFGLQYILKNYPSTFEYISRIYEYYSIFILINSICLFLYFNGIEIKNKITTNIITVVSPLTFGVYLIHENIFVIKKLYSNIFNSLKYASHGIIGLISNWLIFILVVFTICCLIEYIRQKVFKFVSNTKILKKVDALLNKISNNINEIIKTKIDNKKI